MPVQRERITDVSPTLYINEASQRPIESIEQVQEDLWTWWAEADLRPSPIRLFLRDGCLKDKYGNDLFLQAQAAAVIRRGRVEKGRVDAEVSGVERLQKLLLSNESSQGVIYMSPPGSQEEGFGAEGRRRLSFTYLYHKGNAGRIHFLAIPKLAGSVSEDFDKVRDLVDKDRTISLTGPWSGDITDRSLVAYPFVARDKQSLDLAASRLGYDNLVGLWRKALEAKNLRGRAGELIEYASTRIWESYHGKNYERLEVLGDVFRGVVALLVSNDLQDVKDIHQYFDSKVEAILGSRHVDKLGGVSAVLCEPYTNDIREFYFRLQNNDQAMGVIQGGSCPGDRDFGFGQDVFGRKKGFVPSNNVLLDALGVETGYGSNSRGIVESGDKGKKECYQCPMSGCGADVYTRGGDTYCLNGHHKGE